MKVLFLAISLSLGTKAIAQASEDHGMLEVCKAECPQAKSEEEAHTCMKKVVEKKKGDRKFRKTDCFAAFRDHEKHEKEAGHSH